MPHRVRVSSHKRRGKKKVRTKGRSVSGRRQSESQSEGNWPNTMNANADVLTDYLLSSQSLMTLFHNLHKQTCTSWEWLVNNKPSASTIVLYAKPDASAHQCQSRLTFKSSRATRPLMLNTAFLLPLPKCTLSISASCCYSLPRGLIIVAT